MKNKRLWEGRRIKQFLFVFIFLLVGISFVAAQDKTQANSANTTTAMDPDKFIFAMSANPVGLSSYLWYMPSLCFELGKGQFNGEVHIIFPMNKGFGKDIPPTGGFGGLATLNWFKPNRIGGFYLGGGVGYILLKNLHKEEEVYSEDGMHSIIGHIEIIEDAHVFTAGLNIGWKFVLQSGLYFRTGTYLGYVFDLGKESAMYNGFIFFKADLSIGYCFK
jgi:hypothetical protein